MIQKKICMIGASAVGKTSLVSRFVRSEFSDKYHTSVGVKVDKKVVPVDGETVMMVIWDLAGDDDFQRLETSYLRGSAGFLMVADGTRQVTLEQVIEIRQRVSAAIGTAPCVLALNKADLAPQWEVEETRIQSLSGEGWDVVRTSAKEGTGVEEAFAVLARRLAAPTT
jgi:hypothetical protein